MVCFIFINNSFSIHLKNILVNNVEDEPFISWGDIEGTSFFKEDMYSIQFSMKDSINSPICHQVNETTIKINEITSSVEVKDVWKFLMRLRNYKHGFLIDRRRW